MTSAVPADEGTLIMGAYMKESTKSLEEHFSKSSLKPQIGVIQGDLGNYSKSNHLENKLMQCIKPSCFALGKNWHVFGGKHNYKENNYH